MKRVNLAVFVFAVFCGLTVPQLLKYSSSRPGLVFVGTILFFASILTYAYWKGKHIRKTVPRPATWTPVQRRLALKKLEGELKSLQAMRRRPGYVLLFLLFGLTVTGAAIFILPSFPASANEHTFIEAWGTLFGIAYVILTTLFAITWLTGGWERYLDSYILKAENLQAQILSLPH